MVATDNLRKLNFNRQLAGDHPYASLQEWFKGYVREALGFLQERGLVGQNESRSFGVTVKFVPGEQDLMELLEQTDNPEIFFDFSYMTDHNPAEGQRYAANALRKVLATVRTGVATIQLAKDAFVNPIQEGDDTLEMLPWREYPWGGAAIVGRDEENEDLYVLIGVSGFDAWEDHEFALHVARMLRSRIRQMNAERDTADKDESAPVAAEPQG